MWKRCVHARPLFAYFRPDKELEEMHNLLLGVQDFRDVLFKFFTGNLFHLGYRRVVLNKIITF